MTGDGRIGDISESTALIARLESVAFSRWHLRPRIIVGSATFFDAFDALSLAFVLPVLVPLWGLSPGQVGSLISIGYLGQFFGALVFGSLADAIGRVRAAAAAVAIMSVMSLGCAMAPGLAVLLVCRFVQGVGVGGEMPVAAVYINELSKARGRGRFFLLYEMLFPIGLMMTGQIGAVLVPIFGWQVMFLIGGIPGLVITWLLMRLPESPRWLISKHRFAEAEAIVRDMEAHSHRTAALPAPAGRFATGTSSSAAGPAPPRTCRGPQRGSRAGVACRGPQRGPHARQPRVGPEGGRRAGVAWTELLGSAYRRRTVVTWTLWWCAYFITNGLNNWMPTLYNRVYALDIQQSLRAGTLTNVMQVIALLGCAFVIDRTGRRLWTAASFAAGALLLGMLGLFGARSVVAVIALVTLSYGIVGSTNAVLYLYTPEIYPTRLRAIGTGVATCWLRLASSVAPLLVGYIVAVRGIGSVFLMFAGVCVIGAFAAAFMPETRNRRLEDIAL